MTEQDKELGSDCRIKVEVHRLAAEQQSELQNHNASDDGYQL